MNKCAKCLILCGGMLSSGAAASITFAQAPAQLPAPSAIQSMVQDAARLQLEDLRHEPWGVRYRLHRVDSREDSIRDLIETEHGNISRTLVRRGTQLTPDQETADIDRLRTLKEADLDRKRKNAESSDKYAVEMITVLPQAMLFRLTPAQPQLESFKTSQVVLDFTPDPAFHPASSVQSLLQGLEGRVWLDAESHHLLRMELTVVHDLNLFAGLLAKVYQGGTVKYEQQPVGDGHYAYRFIDIDVKLRELMVRAVRFHQTLTATGITYMRRKPTLQQAVDALVATPAPQH